MSPDFIPSQPEGVYLYPFLGLLGGGGGFLLPVRGLGLFHQSVPLPGSRYSKYREPEKVSLKPLSFC